MQNIPSLKIACSHDTDTEIAIELITNTLPLYLEGTID